MKWVLFLVFLSFMALAEDKYEVKGDGGFTKFERITTNEKAINDIMKRLSKLEAQVMKNSKKPDNKQLVQKKKTE